jgi:DeoR/GlpR family transcriptional regulator of sugar metabolism
MSKNRDKKLIDKRREFIANYVKESEKPKKVVYIELSELLFISERTIRDDYYKTEK